ncbi:MAG: AAA family ATPase, partial [Desulfomonilaceae bacterium]
MIVKSISVSNWRNIKRQVYMGPFLEALNIIYAPNGSGKSSLFEALRRGLMDRHNVKGEEINAIQPWNSGLTPEVTVEFSHNGDSYKITKKFIQSPSSLLEKFLKGRYESFADGRKADEILQESLTKNPPTKGLSRAEHWGWAQALWVPQGELALGSLSNDVLSDIRGVLSAHLGSGGSSKVEKEINRLYDQYFTSTGKLKKGKDAPPSVGFKEQLNKAEQDFVSAEQSYEDFQRTSADVETFQAQSAKCYQDRERIKALLASTENEVKKYIELKNEKTRNEKDAEIHGSRHRELNGLIEGIETEEKALANELKQIGSLKEEVKTKKEELVTAEGYFKACKESADNTKTIEAEVGKMNAVAEDARSFADISSRLSDLREKLSNISAAAESLRDYESQKETIKAPDSKTLKTISKAITDRENINVKIEASLMNVEVMAETGLTLDVMKGDTPGPFTINQGSINVFKGSPEVSLRIPEVATIRAWGPTGSVEELRRELDKVEKNILKLTEPYGTADLATLDDL